MSIALNRVALVQMETAASKKREARARRASHRQARRRVVGPRDRIRYRTREESADAGCAKVGTRSSGFGGRSVGLGESLNQLDLNR